MRRAPSRNSGSSGSAARQFSKDGARASPRIVAMTQNANTARRLESIARLALDGAAPTGEQDAAAAAFFRLLRNASMTVENLIDLSSRPEPERRSPIMPFGKFKGRTIAEICRVDPSYSFWIVGAHRIAPAIRKAFADELGIDL